MVLGISKAVGGASTRALTPAELSQPLLAMLGEIRRLRADHGRSELFAQDLDALEESVLRVLRYVEGTAAPATRPVPLSERELNVLVQVAAGRSNKQIARQLGISENTVRNHLTRIFTKLGASNRTEAVVSAMRAGLVRA